MIITACVGTVIRHVLAAMAHLIIALTAMVRKDVGISTRVNVSLDAREALSSTSLKKILRFVSSAEIRTCVNAATRLTLISALSASLRTFCTKGNVKQVVRQALKRTMRQADAIRYRYKKSAYSLSRS